VTLGLCFHIWSLGALHQYEAPSQLNGERAGATLTACRLVELLHDVALVLRVGNVELLLAEQPRDAILLELGMVQQRRYPVQVSCVGSSACLEPVSVCQCRCHGTGGGGVVAHILGGGLKGTGPSRERAQYHNGSGVRLSVCRCHLMPSPTFRGAWATPPLEARANEDAPARAPRQTRSASSSTCFTLAHPQPPVRGSHRPLLRWPRLPASACRPLGASKGPISRTPGGPPVDLNRRRMGCGHSITAEEPLRVQARVGGEPVAGYIPRCRFQSLPFRLRFVQFRFVCIARASCTPLRC
jgi:hypothetical protein